MRGDSGTSDDISIHAPPRGATIVPSLYAPMDTYFNSRPSARGDIRPACIHHSKIISIHAPPRGATYLHRQRRSNSLISIHAPPRGATYE